MSRLLGGVLVTVAAKIHKLYLQSGLHWLPARWGSGPSGPCIGRRCYWKKRSPREKWERALREECAAERHCEGADAILTALVGCIPRGSDHGADLGGTDCSPSEQLSSLALGLRSRYLHAPTIIPAKKPLLDLYGDFVQPFLGTICPVHLIPNVCLQGLYAVFSRFELSRQLLGEIQRLLVVFLNRTGCAVNQAQDRLPRSL